jgi:hypothetical protein
MCSIDFDNQPHFKTNKVDDVTPDLLLSPEFRPLHPPIAQSTSQLPFCVS